MLLLLAVMYVAQHEEGAILLLLLLVVMYVAQYRVGAMLFSLLFRRLPSLLQLLHGVGDVDGGEGFDVGGGDIGGDVDFDVGGDVCGTT